MKAEKVISDYIDRSIKFMGEKDIDYVGARAFQVQTVVIALMLQLEDLRKSKGIKEKNETKRKKSE